MSGGAAFVLSSVSFAEQKSFPISILNALLSFVLFVPFVLRSFRG